MTHLISASLYREQAECLTFLAAETVNGETRLELLEIAASFQKLAKYAATTSDDAGDETNSLTG